MTDRFRLVLAALVGLSVPAGLAGVLAHLLGVEVPPGVTP